MILGVGIDLVAVDRVERLLARHGSRFLARCFADGEAVRPGDAEHLAGLLAAKEAGRGRVLTAAEVAAQAA